MQEANIQVLSTKVLSRELAQSVAHSGIGLTMSPFISTEYYDPAMLRQQISSVEGKAVVFTSANAVSAVAQITGSASFPWNIYCLDGATQEQVKQLFPAATIAATADNAAALSDKIIADGMKAVRFFSGNRRMNTLPELLAKAKIEIDEVTVYETILTPLRLTEHYSGIIFFSPSAVESYLMENDVPEHAVLFVIGHTTATALSGYNNRIIISDRPDPQLLVSLMTTYFKNIS